MTDITELAQMKGQKVEAPYYLAECTECGKIYPSSQLIESRNYLDGDADCYCPHCNATDPDIADCGSEGITAWNYQQARIDSLVEALERKEDQRANWFQMAQKLGEDMDAAEKRIAELEDAEQKLCAANVTLDARAELAERQMAELESRTVTAAAADVLAERKRQVTAEGWTPGHDDEYEHGELADAAGCYALSSDLFDCAGEPPRPWPWPDEWWKPTSRRRDLVKAGALILAEIERIDRAGSGKEGKNQPGMVVAVHIDAGDFVKFRGQVYEVKETDFDDHDVTLWFVCGEALQCAAGCPIEVVSAPGEDE